MTGHDRDEGTAYDCRQYQRMLDSVDAFQEGSLSLRSVIDNLEGLLGQLNSVNPDWRRAFEHEWGKLEDVYAFALDQGSGIDAEGKGLIAEALERIKSLVSSALAGVSGR